MKLVDILARELKAWPAGDAALVQGSFGQVYIAGGGPIIIETEKSSDWELAEVTREEWRATVDAQIAAPQNDESQNVARIEWDGEGYPQVGARCEYFDGGEWMQCEVVAHRKGGWVVLSDDLETDFVTLEALRPIRTSEEVEAILNWLVNRDSERGLRGIAEDLHAHGYRKP
jgi:hypothetical protein